MAGKRSPGAGRAAITKDWTDLDPNAVEHAVHLVHQVCCFAGAFELLEEFRDPALAAAVERHDTGALFDRLIYDFSFQGISDEIAANYMAKHGQATWTSIRSNLDRQPNCPKLQTYWHFHDCRYEKTSGTCADRTTFGPALCRLISCETATSISLLTACICLFGTLPMGI